MDHIRTFIVRPSLPASLEPLRDLAYNLWWTWSPQARELFRRLDVELWERVGHNPVALLWEVNQARLEQMATDPGYKAQLERVLNDFRADTQGKTWFDERFAQHQGDVIAYFSAEFGLHESLRIYSGGLGVLAGDHLKAASDIGIPIVGVGLMYRQGYFEQQLSEDGWQLENYPSHDFHRWCVKRVQNNGDQPVQISVRLGSQTLNAQVWHCQVGRVSLYLLDADIPENPPELRSVTARLYGGDHLMRIRQEILLGIGGFRALRTLGIQPTVCHMNEGHAAFLALERIRQLMQEHGLSYAEARAATAGGNIFTTHTPVPAGIDKFEPKLIEQQLGWIAGELRISLPELLALGRENGDRPDGPFGMAILALRNAYRSNAVSQLHGEVARRMWQSTWPGVPRDEVPIVHVTNGIHLRSWLSLPMRELMDQYLGTGWAEAPPESEVWRRIDDIPDGELWRVRVRRREHLVGTVRRRLRDQLTLRGVAAAQIKEAEDVLDPEALTIGFARRFAPYKRATLLFRNLDRLRKLVAHSAQPIQFIFAGKAHPNDGAGKELIKQVMSVCRQPEFRRHIVFLENYEMRLARVLTQGVDVWLNNPLRLHEASGTSGMKVPLNGGLNLSCLDGWWPEAYNGRNGWAIGDGRVHDDLAYQDHVESESLYNLLEREIVPLFYERAVDGVPRRWIARVKESMKTICPVFSTVRMLREYTEKLYLPALCRYRHLARDNFAATRALAQWQERVSAQWNQVRIERVETDAPQVLTVGDQLPVRARVRLGSVDPKDVLVEVFHGNIDAAGELTNGHATALRHVRQENDGLHYYEGAVSCTRSGQHGYALRVVPNHEDLADRYAQGLITWG